MANVVNVWSRPPVVAKAKVPADVEAWLQKIEALVAVHQARAAADATRATLERVQSGSAAQVAKVRVKSVGRLLGEAIKRIHHGDSISSLFV